MASNQSSAVNYTIDDSQWSTSALNLTPGWNMLRVNGSNQYINDTQVGEVTPLLPHFWNSSLSWTTQENSSTTLFFQDGSDLPPVLSFQLVGTDIWAYGMSGPEQGPYYVAIDNATANEYTAYANETDYHYLLYASHGLDPSSTHTLTLTNGQNGSILAFDMAFVQRPIGSVSSQSTPMTPSSKAPNNTTPVNATTMVEMEIEHAEMQLAKQWTPQQLAALTTQIPFHWNVAAYFTIVVACLAIAIIAFLSLQHLLRQHRNRAMTRRTNDGSSYLLTRKPRPSTRIIDALRKGKISRPVASEDGHSEMTIRSEEEGQKEYEVHGL